MDKKEFALKQHEAWKGKIEVISRASIETPEELSVAYTPGVAEPCLKISEDVDLSYKYTRRGNMVAVVTDGTAVLGLGDIGPEAGMPVMEGKCALFKAFGAVLRYWVWAISVQKQECRSWKENALYLKPLVMWMHFLFACAPRM